MKRYILVIVLLIILLNVDKIEKGSLKTSINSNYIEEVVNFNKKVFNKESNIEIETKRKDEKRKEKEILKIIKSYEGFEFVEVRVKKDKVYIGVAVADELDVVNYTINKKKIKKEIKKSLENITQVTFSRDLELIESINN